MNQRMINPKVSVLIPAHNEEKNIGHLLQAVLRQCFSGVELVEVLVCSDDSTDHTVVAAKQVVDSRLRVIENKVRLGANATQNVLLRQAKGDILILLNADIDFAHEACLMQLVQPLLEDAAIGITAAKLENMPIRGFFESILESGQKFRQGLFELVDPDGDTLYLCNGRARAFSRWFADQLVWPDQCPEDSYSYLFCQLRGFKFRFVPESRVLFRLPNSWSDHVKQSHRYAVGKKILERLFREREVLTAYTLPLSLVMQQSTHMFLRAPLKFPLYLLVVFAVRFSHIGRDSEQSRWELSQSSKQLYDL